MNRGESLDRTPGKVSKNRSKDLLDSAELASESVSHFLEHRPPLNRIFFH